MKICSLRRTCKSETPVKTSDGYELVLFHDEPISEEEIRVFSEFTREEIKMIAKGIFGMREEVAE